MRAGNLRVARLLVLAALLPASRLEATPARGLIGDLPTRVLHFFALRHLLAADHGAPQVPGSQTPRSQPLPPADANGPTVDAGRLDQPADIEATLRAALRQPLTSTRLTVTGGTAHLGKYLIPAGQTVHGNVVVLEGDAEVLGHLIGNLVTLDGSVSVAPDATVSGDVLAIAGHVVDAGGISGSKQWLEPEAPPVVAAERPVPFQVLTRAGGLVGVTAMLLLFGFALVTFGRPNLEIVSDTVAHSFGRSFLAGLLGQVLVLPTIGLVVVGLVLTIAGTLLVPFAVAVYSFLVIVATLIGVLAVAHAMGERITRRRMARGVSLSPNSYRYMLTGLAGLASIWVAWVAFGWVPFAGVLILTMAALGTWGIGTVGFGAALLSRGGVREQFAGRLLPPEMMTDEYLWATPQFGVPVVKRPTPPEEK